MSAGLIQRDPRLFRISPKVIFFGKGVTVPLALFFDARHEPHPVEEPMQVVGSLLRRPARSCDPTSYAAATLVIFQTRRRRRGWWELAGRQMLNQLVERKFFRGGRWWLLHRQEQRPACVRDTPLARLARDQLLAEDIEVWRPLSQALHAAGPL
jgi:hypothetical protein